MSLTVCSVKICVELNDIVLCAATIGFFAPLPAKPGQEEAFPDFLRTGYTLLDGEPLTLQWYGVKYDDKDTYAVFDTFFEEKGREAHLNGKSLECLVEYQCLQIRYTQIRTRSGKIARALITNAPTLVEGSPTIHRIKILEAKVGDPG